MKELPCVSMKLVDGKLQVGEQGTHRDAIGEFDRAIKELFEDKEVYVALANNLPDTIRRTLTVALRDSKSPACEGGAGDLTIDDVNEVVGILYR